MRKWIITLSCVFVCALAQQASAAVKYKRFPHCGEGYVTQKTCECHAGTTSRYHFCHAGHFCHASSGECRE